MDMLVRLQKRAETLACHALCGLRFVRESSCPKRSRAFLSRSSNRIILILLIFPVLALLDIACSSEGADQFWRELGFSQNPDDLLRDILSRREFRESHRASFLASLIKWFLTLISNLLKKIFGKWSLDIEGEMVWTAVGAFFAVILVATILVGLYFAVKSFLSRERRMTNDCPHV